MRCPDCNKFVPNDEVEPEVLSVDVDSTGTVSSSVRIVNACGECGAELTEGEFDVQGEVDLPEELLDEGGNLKEGWVLEAEEEHSERTSRTTGKGRGTRTFYGFSLEAKVVARKEGSADVEVGSVTLADECQASSMESLG